MKSEGRLYCLSLKDIQETLQGKELFDNYRHYGQYFKDNSCTAVVNPLEGHKISEQYRIKMTDWMIEVCTSFKCAPRTYFLAVTILDKYLLASI